MQLGQTSAGLNKGQVLIVRLIQGNTSSSATSSNRAQMDGSSEVEDPVGLERHEGSEYGSDFMSEDEVCHIKL